MSQPDPARRAAFFLINAVGAEGKLMSELLTDEGPLAKLPPEQAARAQRLATDTFRWMDRADRLLAKYLRKAPPPPVMNLMRLGTVEICVNKEASHGVVNTCVAIARSSKKLTHLSGLINATLRKVATEGPVEWGKLPVPQLPKPLRKPMVAAFGNSAVQKIEAAHSDGAPLDLTPKDGDAQALAAKVGGIALPSGSVRIRENVQVSNLKGYATGDWWVQDVAAAMPVSVLAPKENETVLDLCAAPGGKTMQIAAKGAKVTALDISKSRMGRVKENLDRTKLQADLVVGDALQAQGQFDAILLDAPCSATGTIRRHPDLTLAKAKAEFNELYLLQARMLEHGLTLLKPGGRMVYCTCSLLPMEGEAQIKAFLSRHPNAKTYIPDLPWIEDHWRSPEGGLRLRPDYWAENGGMDGFYICGIQL